MRASILAVGSELLGTDRLDTNSLELTGLLGRYGVELRYKAVVGDVEADLERELLSALERSDLVLVTGGLGPTADDVTREAAAAALGLEITEDAALVEEIRSRFAHMGLVMPEVNRRQAGVPALARVLSNSRGTAPGLLFEHGGAHLFLFPGVPSELRGMMAEHLEPWLAEHTDGVERESAHLRVACVPESTLEERIVPAYEEFGREAITVLARPGDIELRFTATGPARERRRRLDAMSRRLTELVGKAVYSDHVDASLESVVGELLAARGETVATAESCTGGLVAERLTRVPGSSAYFRGAIVAYANDVKVAELGVSEKTLEEHGAVSEATAREMAEGARERLGAHHALALTGIAGPGGGTESKPVGTVHIALASPAGTRHRRIGYPVDRERVRQLSSQVALELLRRHLLS